MNISSFEQARIDYRNWLANGSKKSQTQPTPPMAQKAVAVEKVWPSLEKPSAVSKRTKIEHKKLVRKANNLNPHNPSSPIKKNELEKTKIFWDSSLPTNQYPILRGLAKVLSLNPDTITVNRAETLRDIVNMAIKNIGSEDESKIYQWIAQKMREFRISGERPEAQLRMYLAMK